MISWKNSFKRLNEEYELAKKKKQAVDNLYITGKISQFTRDSFNKDILATIADIERQQKDLVEKMQIKTDELSCQITTLESLLANYEIQHVIGEIEEEAYQRDSLLLTAGIDAARTELDTIKQATMQLCAPVPTIQPPASPNITVAALTIDPPVMESAPIDDVTQIDLSLPLDAPVESTLFETPTFEADLTPITENIVDEQTFTAETPVVVEEAVMEVAPVVVEEVTSFVSAGIDDSVIEVAATEPVFLANESPVMDYAATVEEAPLETNSIINASLEEVNAEIVTEEVVTDVPLQVFEVTKQAPVEQTLEKVLEQLNSPVVETLTVEEMAHDSHPSTAPHQAPSDIIAEAVSDGQIEESDEDITE